MAEQEEDVQLVLQPLFPHVAHVSVPVIVVHLPLPEQPHVYRTVYVPKYNEKQLPEQVE